MKKVLSIFLVCVFLFTAPLSTAAATSYTGNMKPLDLESSSRPKVDWSKYSNLDDAMSLLFGYLENGDLNSAVSVIADGKFAMKVRAYEAAQLDNNRYTVEEIAYYYTSGKENNMMVYVSPILNDTEKEFIIEVYYGKLTESGWNANGISLNGQGLYMNLEFDRGFSLLYYYAGDFVNFNDHNITADTTIKNYVSEQYQFYDDKDPYKAPYDVFWAGGWSRHTTESGTQINRNTVHNTWKEFNGTYWDWIVVYDDAGNVIKNTMGQ